MSLVIDAVVAIEQVLLLVGATKPALAVSIIRAILDTLTDARHQRITSEFAKNEFQRLIGGLAANDLAADELLDGKFKPE